MKTRRFLGWVAMATMVLSTGCSNDEVVNDFSQENAIQFGTYVGRGAESRGTVITTDGSDNTSDALTTKGFGVFAYYTGTADFNASTHTPNFMYNQKVTGVQGDNKITWSYSPVKYWPNNKGDKVTFLAYAPYYENKTLNNDNQSLTFNISNTDIKGQEDILYLCQNTNTTNADGSCSVNHKTINLTKQDVDDKVQFHFLHALSRVGFYAEVMVDEVNVDQTGDPDDNKDSNGTAVGNGDLASETKITIEEIELIGKFYSTGSLNLKEGIWTPTASSSEYNFKLTTDNLVNNVFDGDADNATGAAPDADVSIRQVNKTDSYLMIIPQDFVASGTTLAAGEGIKIRVKYTVVTTDANNSSNTSTVTNDVTSDEFVFNFEQGKAYSFNLHLGMTSVKFSASVGEWIEGGNTAVNVPINTPNP